tara:strand:- start:648 stop:1019 length:372 start_codon:yes stop_codon:yes gene_type:complete
MEGDRAVRRSFKKDILPKEPPHKNVREYKRKAQYKTKQKRCTDLEILLQDYKEQIGADFNAKELAYRCGVHKNTVARWFYGFCPHPILWWNIAKYVSLHTGTSAELIHADIKTTITNFKAGEQ